MTAPIRFAATVLLDRKNSERQLLSKQPNLSKQQLQERLVWYAATINRRLEYHRLALKQIPKDVKIIFTYQPEHDVVLRHPDRFIPYDQLKPNVKRQMGSIIESAKILWPREQTASQYQRGRVFDKKPASGLDRLKEGIRRTLSPGKNPLPPLEPLTDFIDNVLRSAVREWRAMLAAKKNTG